MGYRSDVRIVVSKEGFRELREYVERESAKVRSQKPDSDYSWNLLECTDSIRTDGDQFLISWNDIKWYDGCYEDVDIIVDGLEHLNNEGYGYRFYRVGESYDDIEETIVDGDLDQDLDYLYVVRYIDDDCIKGKTISYEELDNCNIEGGE